MCFNHVSRAPQVVARPLNLIVRLSLLEELKSSPIHPLRSNESSLRSAASSIVGQRADRKWGSVARTHRGAVGGRRVSASPLKGSAVWSTLRWASFSIGGLRPGEQPEPELSSTAPLGGSFEDVRRAAI